ncbi:MAG: hypothetical protein K2K91_04360 [Ruminococcus sp.]|nr:hypothetical protein [Ruminococcus sp.]MDE7098785.1 hypothetical protein [Ruminococcus sp.]
MQMIKGIPIKLYLDSSIEIVENVLVGEPALSDSAIGNSKIITYILAIPKGDLHDWTNKKIEFFDKKFRTVGKEIQGIEANIPLCWHKKIAVEELIPNGNCTFFDSRDFTRHIYSDVLFFDNRSFIRDKTGEMKNGSLDIQIYAVNNTDFTWLPKVGDYVVPEICDFEFDTSDERKISESMANFRKKYNNFAVVNSVERRENDIIISAR